MTDPGPAERARENVVGIVSMLVTGIWLAALFAGFEYWLALLLLGYIVVVPITAMLFGDEEDREEWSDETGDHRERARDAGRSGNDDALAELRARYARGELTDEQFERKVEKLLETDTLENVEDRHGDRLREVE